MHFFGVMLCTWVDRYRAPPTPIQGMRMILGSGVRGLWYWFVKEVGQVINLLNDIDSTVAMQVQAGCGSQLLDVHDCP